MFGQTAFFLCECQNLGLFRASRANDALIVAVGLQISNTVVSSYIVDCYPLQSMNIILFYSVVLDLSAFISPVSRATPYLQSLCIRVLVADFHYTVLHKRLDSIVWLHNHPLFTRVDCFWLGCSSHCCGPSLWRLDEGEILESHMGES
jgi:hypothetical protein